MTEHDTQHPREITAAWLSEQLGRHVDQFDFEIIGRDRGFVGTVARFTLDPRGTPTSVIAKVTNAAETRWYRESSSLLPMLIPQYLGGTTTMLLLEDLAGLAPGDVLNGANADQVLAVMTAMSEVRAARPSRPEWLAQWSGGDIERTAKRLSSTLPNLDRYADVSTDTKTLLERVSGRLPELVAQLQRGPLGVIHRDLHLDNVFFDRERTVLTDWQNVSWGPVALDIAHLLVEMPTIADRRLIENPSRAALGDDLVLGLLWYVIGSVDWVINGRRDDVHPRKLAVMNDMLGSGKLFGALSDWDAAGVIDRLK